MNVRALLASLVCAGLSCYSHACASAAGNALSVHGWYATTLNSFNQIAAQVEYVHEHSLVLDNEEIVLIIDGILGLYATAQWALQVARSGSEHDKDEQVVDQEAYTYLCNVYVLVDRALTEIKQFFSEDQRSYVLYIREILAESLTQL